MSKEAPSPSPVERILAWQCIGCGKLEAPRPCIGVCQDCPVEVVDAQAYDALQARLQETTALLRQLVLVTPREGEWERSWRHFQQQARHLLSSPGGPDITI